MKVNNNPSNDKYKSHSRSRSRSRDRKHRSPSNSSHGEKGIKLYVANIDSNYNERMVKEEFEKCGEVLDISLKKKQGKNTYSFGYVVMAKKAEADEAIHYISK
ncbi:MAG: RNA-binding protein [archaeon]|nr:RNA-binding protein [archaeon]